MEERPSPLHAPPPNLLREANMATPETDRDKLAEEEEKDIDPQAPADSRVDYERRELEAREVWDRLGLEREEG